MVKKDPDLKPEDRQRRITALSHGSMFRLNAIRPDLCAAYLRAWAEDRKRWEYHLEQLPAGLSPVAAIRLLPADGMPMLGHRLRRAPKPRYRPPLPRDPAVLAPAVAPAGLRSGALEAVGAGR